ncbi:NACHT domain-containing protein [Streptomyces sp. NPDC048508]|uniref:NACHT domain-containing protein n=1 Tax=Streptomyces sp. NPDC048508 TaxID=3365561 RepID=UPI0037131ADC
MAGLGGRRHRRKWQLVGFVCAGLITASAVFAVWHIVYGGGQPIDAAGLLGLPVGVAGLAAAVMALRRPIEGNDTELAYARARTLARQIKNEEGRVWRQLLGADTQRINLGYVLLPETNRAASAPPAGRTFADNTSTTLPDVLEYYRSTRPQRLVITGAAGAGKTVLSLELILALIDHRADDDPVPVRIPLALWEITQPLTDLMVQRLTDSYDWPPVLAEQLVNQGFVLPILDGLDEMDPACNDGRPDSAAPRALAALEAFNAYQEGRDAGPLVLTCRTDHYDVLGPTVRLIDAAHVAISPVPSEQAVSYLRQRARDITRWQHLINHLEADPSGPLATTLSTPWRLCLTATVYHRRGDPSRLIYHLAAGSLDAHLLAGYIPAVSLNTWNPNRYHPDDVHRWLFELADHLGDTTTSIFTTDLTLHRLWPLAGPQRVLVTDALLTAFATLLILFPAAWALSNTLDDIGAFGVNRIMGDLSSYSNLSLFLTMLSAVAAALMTGMLTVLVGEPHRLPRFGRNSQISISISGLGADFAMAWIVGLSCALFVALFYSMLWSFLIVVGDTVTAVSATCMLRDEPIAAARPWRIIRDHMVWGLAVALIRASMVGLMIGFATGFKVGLIVGFIMGCLLSLTGVSTARRYAIFLICSGRRVPFRLARFLDWAVTAGLMRYSGSAYQFRHRELQYWLVNHSRPATQDESWL